MGNGDERRELPAIDCCMVWNAIVIWGDVKWEEAESSERNGKDDFEV